MAYYNQDQEQDDKDNSQGMNSTETAAAPTEPVQLSNQSSVSTTSAAPQAPKTAKPASSGSAPGFQNYTKANQGNAQTKLNNAATQNVVASGQNATNAITNAQDQFGKKVDAGTLANRQQAVQDVANTVQSARTLTAAPKVETQTAQAGLATDNSAATNFDKPATTPVPAGVTGVDRFKEVINAQYGGPESLRQAGLYSNVAGKVDSAQNTLNNTKTAAGREEMLKNLYQQRADYTSGLNKLDSALLNSSQQGVQSLQNAAKAQGNLTQKLDRAQIDSATAAQNRTTEINDIRKQALDTFSTGKKAEEAATEKRLDDMLVTPVKDAKGNDIMKADGTPMTQWDQLPEQFKNVIRNKQADNAAALAAETAKLGTAPDAAALAAADKARVTASAQRQMAMFQGLDTSEADRKYQEALANFNSLKSASDAYNAQLTPLQQKYNPNAVNFNSAEAAFLGINNGEGLYNLGENAIKTGDAHRDQLISRDEQARQAALAQLAGYDLSNQLDTNLKYTDADKAGTQSIYNSIDLAGTRAGLNEAEKNFQTAADTNISATGSKKNKDNGKRYYATETANMKDLLQNSGYDFNAGNAGVTGNADILKNIGNVSDLSQFSDPKTMNEVLRPIGVPDSTSFNTAQDIGGTWIDANPVSYGVNLASALFGGNTVGQNFASLFGGGANTAESKNDAKIDANKKLNAAIQNNLDASGFQNRAMVDDNNVSGARLAALQQLLANLDKTNS